LRDLVPWLLLLHVLPAIVAIGSNFAYSTIRALASTSGSPPALAAGDSRFAGRDRDADTPPGGGFPDGRESAVLDRSYEGAMPNVETSTPLNTPTPIGPYSHIARVGQFITIGAIAGVDPATGQMAGNDVASQTQQIIHNFRVMLESVGSDLNHVIHITVFLTSMSDFEPMNAAYVAVIVAHRPARTVIGVRELPMPGALLTMNLSAVTRD